MSDTRQPTRTEGSAADGGATRIVVSYDESALDERLRGWVARQLRRGSYRRYLARARETAAEGDEWEEFVSRGCGAPVDVTFRVERVEGGPRLGPGATVEIEPR